MKTLQGVNGETVSVNPAHVAGVVADTVAGQCILHLVGGGTVQVIGTVESVTKAITPKAK